MFCWPPDGFGSNRYGGLGQVRRGFGPFDSVAYVVVAHEVIAFIVLIYAECAWGGLPGGNCL
jgi:hypothetical protein